MANRELSIKLPNFQLPIGFQTNGNELFIAIIEKSKLAALTRQLVGHIALDGFGKIPIVGHFKNLSIQKVMDLARFGQFFFTQFFENIVQLTGDLTAVLLPVGIVQAILQKRQQSVVSEKILGVKKR